MCDHPTILEMLNIANPVIANCLIDQVILETIRILHLLSLRWQSDLVIDGMIDFMYTFDYVIKKLTGQNTWKRKLE